MLDRRGRSCDYENLRWHSSQELSPGPGAPSGTSCVSNFRCIQTQASKADRGFEVLADASQGAMSTRVDVRHRVLGLENRRFFQGEDGLALTERRWNEVSNLREVSLACKN